MQDEIATESQNVIAPGRPGARCLAAGQRVCTARGAVAVEELARAGAFEAICYDANTRCYVTRTAKAAAVGAKTAIRLHTDKGPFELTPDQPVMLELGGVLPASELRPGTRLHACAVKPEVGYLVKSADLGKERLDLEHLTEADCAVSNWYPVPSIDDLGEKEVYAVEIGSGGAQPNVVIWAAGPGGGIGIAITL